MLTFATRCDNIHFVARETKRKQLNKWRDIEELSKLVKFLIVGRPNNSFHQENYIKYNCELLNFDGPDISSTKFKETFARYSFYKKTNQGYENRFNR